MYVPHIKDIQNRFSPHCCKNRLRTRAALLYSQKGTIFKSKYRYYLQRNSTGTQFAKLKGFILTYTHLLWIFLSLNDQLPFISVTFPSKHLKHTLSLPNFKRD